MKIRISLILVLSMLFACKKGSDNGGNPTPYQPFVYLPTYDSTITITPNATYAFDFDIIVHSGDISKNNVHMTIASLPAGFSVSPSYQDVGYVEGGIFMFNTGNCALGLDTAILSIGTDSGGTTNHSIIFNVQPFPDVSAILNGTYAASFDFCEPDTLIYYTSVVMANLSMPYHFTISNIKNMGPGFIVNAQVSQTMPHTIIIPYQTASGGYKIWGSGIYAPDNPPNGSLYQMTISDTLVHGTDTTECTIHLQHTP
jgi:hypothetical protein